MSDDKFIQQYGQKDIEIVSDEVVLKAFIR